MDTNKPSMFRPNIIVIDTKAKDFKGARERAGFLNEQEAEDYIETHERPMDLDCEFDPIHKKRILKS